MNGMEIRAFSPIGAQIVGLDLRKPVSEEAAMALRDAFNEHLVLLFREQELETEDMLRTARIFGEINDQGEAPGGMNLISNVTKHGLNEMGEMTLRGGDGELLQHFDHCFQEHVLQAIMLYGVTVPPVGGDTLFTDVRRITRDLPEDFYKRIEPLSIRHKSSTRTGQPEAIHPLLFTHPRTHERVLFFSKIHAREIIGVTPEENEELMRILHGLVERQDEVHRHTWRPNDLVVFDNIALHHRRENFDPKYSRHLKRVQIGRA